MTARESRGGTEWVSLWDGRRWPGRVREGLPEFRFGQEPSGHSTRMQLRERGVSRGGQEPFARLTWKRDRRFAWLYVDDKARAKRTPSDKQLAAVNKALAARKVCAERGPVDHLVRTTDWLCGDCYAAGVTPTEGGTAGWRTLHDWQANAVGGDRADAEPGERGSDLTDRDEAAAAVDRAAQAVTRAAARIGRNAEAERDEQLARWHADDQAARPIAAQSDTDDQGWSQIERGAA